MSEPFLAEVRIVGFNFAPRGWAFCDGQILPINQNQSLYSLLGTTYGGDGRTSFALPDMRGRTPMHVGSSNGQSHQQGQKSGEETHTLSAGEMPQHDHVLEATNNSANQPSPLGHVPAQVSAGVDFVYSSASDNLNANLNSASIANVGGGQAHNNMQPTIAVNFCIALRGLFPSRN
ncbi:MAG: phage tail protein [bacterium]|nr:phage tail protein [bacterium]